MLLATRPALELLMLWQLSVCGSYSMYMVFPVALSREMGFDFNVFGSFDLAGFCSATPFPTVCLFCCARTRGGYQ